MEYKELPPLMVNGVPMRSVQGYLDRERGRRCWILGGGPSLLNLKPDEFRPDDVVIAVNFSVWANERLGLPRAKYWIFGDLAMLWRPGFPVADPTLYPDMHKFVSGPPMHFLLGRGWLPSDDGLGNTFFPFFNSDVPQVHRKADYLWTQQSTLNAALSLAWVLGCSEVHIRGADFGVKYGDGRAHWYDAPGPTTDPLQAGVDYTRMKRPVQFLIGAMRIQDPTLIITAGGDPSILEA